MSVAPTPKKFNTMELDTIQTQNRLFEIGDKKEAEAHAERVSIKKLENGKLKGISAWADLDTFQQFGHGAYLYFAFMKYTTLLLFFLSLFSIAPIVLNISGHGLGTAAGNNFLLTSSLGNLKKFEVEESVMPYLIGKEVWTNQKRAEYQSYRILNMLSHIFYVISLVIYYCYLRYKMPKLARMVESVTVTVTDYTIEAKGLPNEPINPEELAQFIEIAFKVKVKRVNFAYKFGNTLVNFRRLGDFEMKKKVAQIKYGKKPSKMQSEIEKLNKNTRKEQEKLRLKYIKNNIHAGNHFSDFSLLRVHKAFITFEHHRAPEYVLSRSKHFFRRVCFCCKKNPRDKKFRGRYKLEFSLPDHPENIKWENLEYSKFNRFLRSTLTLFASGLIIIICFLLVFGLSTVTSGLETAQECPVQKINFSDLKAVENKDSYEKTRICYCKQLGYTGILSNENQRSLCGDFIQDLVYLQLLSFASGIIISVANNFLKFVLDKFSEFQKYRSETHELSSNTIKILIVTYLNTVFMVLLGHAEIFGFRPAEALLDIFRINSSSIETFKEFNREWYLIVGFKITSTILIAIFSPHVLNLLLIPIYKCYARIKLAGAKLQVEMNKALEPQKFEVVDNYVTALNVLLVTITFCGGIPLLSFITLVAFLCMYWTQKLAFVWWCKRPPMLGYRLTKGVIATLPFGILAHICFCTYFYGNAEIFIDLQSDFMKNMFDGVKGVTIGFFAKLAVNPVSTFFIVMLILYILMRNVFLEVFGFCLGFFKKTEDDLSDMANFGYDKSGYGTFTQNYERIKLNALGSYDLRENPKYANILLLAQAYDKGTGVSKKKIAQQYK